MVLSLEKKTHFPTVRVPLDDFGLCRNFTSARRMLSSDMTFSFCLCLRWETPNHGPKKQFLTGVRLTIAIFGLMNIQNLQPLACPLSQPTSLCRIFLRCSAGRSPRPSPHRAKAYERHGGNPLSYEQNTSVDGFCWGGVWIHTKKHPY